MKKLSIWILALVVLAALYFGYRALKETPKEELIKEEETEVVSEEALPQEPIEEVFEEIKEEGVDEVVEEVTPEETAPGEIEEVTAEEGTGEAIQETEPTTLSNDSLKVTSVQPNETLPNPFLVQGEAKTVKVVHFKVNNPKGETLFTAKTNVVKKETDEWGTFAVNLSYDFQHTTEGTLEVFELSDDGSEINKIIIPVKFLVAEVESEATE